MGRLTLNVLLSFAQFVLVKVDARPLLGSDDENGTWDIVLPPLPKKPFREAKLIMPVDDQPGASADPKLVELLRDAAGARALVERDPELPLHRIAGASVGAGSR